ncbi:Methyltransferase domain-containing protein [Altererythrobacter xiamenensis]|uniref:Methyltransferase domain-containing protein n=1 Tax=Altererythrobacter xiamenensis TaxID=1316679 RepID=A0A1Y6F458_9SPHN|nr:class I SAM-dependent methyltransferase [Altererythrobacter xiamenensis]SMQ69674.1 Methyltransferase domain-containing protein [Altererythrobacter xiamenensis]
MDSISLHSGDYVERFKSSPTFRVSRLIPLMDVGPTDRVVDFGCGIGMLLDCLDCFDSYDGVDFSPDFIAVANEKAGDNARFHCADIVDFCKNNQSAFDVATTLDFSEHIDDETFLTIYSAIKDSLVLNGRLYLHTPNLDFFLERAKDIGIIRQFPEHIAVRTAGQHKRLLEKCGFGAIKISTIPHYNILRKIHPLSHLPIVGSFFAARLWIEASVTK